MGENEFDLPFEVDNPAEQLAWQAITEYLNKEQARKKTLMANPAVLLNIHKLMSVLKELDDGCNQFSIKTITSDISKSLAVVVNLEDFEVVENSAVRKFANAISLCDEIECSEAPTSGIIAFSFWFKDAFVELQAEE